MKTPNLDPSIVEPPYEFQKLLGFEMVEWTAEHVVFHLPLKVALQNRYGIPHGGVYAALLDTVMGYAGCYTGRVDKPKMAMTLNLNVNFLSRPKGKLLIATARKTGGGKRTFFAEGSICDEVGELVSTGTGAFRYRSVT
jgi:uncharacterized protein (TIGR00369 family)